MAFREPPGAKNANHLPPINEHKLNPKKNHGGRTSESKRGSAETVQTERSKRTNATNKKGGGETTRFKLKSKLGVGGGDDAPPAPSGIFDKKGKADGNESDQSATAFDGGEMGSFGDIFQAIIEDKNVKKKVIKKAPGAEELKYLVGPEVIDSTNIERTPIPLWVKEASLARFSQVLEKTSDDIIERTPVESNIEVKFIKDEKKTPEMSWALSLTHIEEDELDAEAEIVDSVKIKLNYDAPSIVDKEAVYIVIPSKVINPDGSITVKDKIRVILAETDTEFTLQLKGNYVPDHSEHIHETRKKNEHYKKVLRLHKESDAYTDRESQTFYERERDKSTLMKLVQTEELAIQTDSFAIHDEFAALEEKEAIQKRKDEDEALMTKLMKMKSTTQYNERSGKPRRQSELTDDSDDDDYRTKGTDDIDWALYDDDSEEELKTPPNEISEEELNMSSDLDEFETELTLDEVYAKKLEKSTRVGPRVLPDISFAIMIIERMISMNIHQDKQAGMRAFDILPPEREKSLRPMYMRQLTRKSQLIDFGPSLKRYWTYKCFSVTEGREVTSMILHPTNGNMICTAFGSVEFANESEGTVCIWSAKNVLYPERIYQFRVSVTAIAFSSLTPYLLAIGLIDGHLLVYDIRPNLTPQVIYSTIGTTNKHTGPIWEIAWMKETEVSSSGKVKDVLISIGDEGLIYRWAGGSGKGFNFQTLLKIRRSSMKIPGRRERRAEALISQHSSTFAICFFPTDPTKYLIGTEEGFIHKCSAAYVEQYISTYIGHAGPIYRIVFSPFSKDIFISSAGDWSVKIWKEDLTAPLISLMTGLRTIFDVTPCPFMSSVFICLAEYEIQVWDLTINTLEPVIQLASSPPNGLRKVLFSSHLKSVIIADTDGIINLYGLRNFPTQPSDPVEQVEQLLEQIIPGYRRPAKDTPSLQLDMKPSKKDKMYGKEGRNSEMKNMSKSEREGRKKAGENAELEETPEKHEPNITYEDEQMSTM